MNFSREQLDEQYSRLNYKSHAWKLKDVKAVYRVFLLNNHPDKLASDTDADVKLGHERFTSLNGLWQKLLLSGRFL